MYRMSSRIYVQEKKNKAIAYSKAMLVLEGVKKILTKKINSTERRKWGISIDIEDRDGLANLCVRSESIPIDLRNYITDLLTNEEHGIQPELKKHKFVMCHTRMLT